MNRRFTGWPTTADDVLLELAIRLPRYGNDAGGIVNGWSGHR